MSSGSKSLTSSYTHAECTFGIWTCGKYKVVQLNRQSILICGHLNSMTLVCFKLSRYKIWLYSHSLCTETFIMLYNSEVKILSPQAGAAENPLLPVAAYVTSCCWQGETLIREAILWWRFWGVSNSNKTPFLFLLQDCTCLSIWGVGCFVQQASAVSVPGRPRPLGEQRPGWAEISHRGWQPGPAPPPWFP